MHGVHSQIRRRARRAAAFASLSAALALGVTSGAQAAESGLNGRFVYSKGGSIWVMNADGTGATRLTPGGAYAPSWSPDGTKIAYLLVSDPWGRYSLAVMDADGGNRRYYTTHTYFQESGNPDDQPTWSPDGTKIAATFATGAGHDVFVVDATLAGSARQITTDGASRHPDWGRNGKLAYVGRYGQDAQAVWVADPATGSREWRVSSWSRLSAPDWRGDTTAFATKGDIFRNDAVGSLGTTASDDNPVLSPDGNSVAFTSESGGRRGIHVQSLAGGTTTRLDDADGPFDWASLAPPPSRLEQRTCCAM